MTQLRLSQVSSALGGAIGSNVNLVASSVSEDVASTATSANIDIPIPAGRTVTHVVQARAEAANNSRCTVRLAVESIRSGSAVPIVESANTFTIYTGLTINATQNGNGVRINVTNTMGFACHMTIRVWEVESDVTVDDS